MNSNFSMSDRKVQICICDKTVTAENTVEYSMPDYQPEIRRLLRVKTTIMPPSSYVGGGKAEFSGNVRYDVLYSGSDGGLYSVNFADNYELSAPIDNDSDIDYSDEMVSFCDVEPDSVVSRVIGPRKLNIRCRLHGHIRAYGSKSLDEKIDIVATEKENGLIIHIAKQLPENPAAEFHAVVNADARQKAANNHTATHLVDYALRTVLGSHVEQKGSMVGPMGLRFDFSHFQKVSAEELREVERLVNKLIRTNYPLVENREATMAEAEAAGAIMLFGEKYGDKVRIVNFGPSTELCGGTHTSATGTIGLFKITSESAISAGVRRIEAVTGEAAETMVYTAQDMILSLEQMVHNPKLVQAIEKMMESNDALGREVAEMRKEKVAQLAEDLAENTPMRGGVKLITHTSKHMPEVMKDLAFALRARVPERLVMVVGNLFDGKPTLNIMLSDDVVAMGVDAGATVREAAKLMNGGGGGQKHYAMAGGKNPDGLQAAVDKAVEMIMEKVK